MGVLGSVYRKWLGYRAIGYDIDPKKTEVSFEQLKKECDTFIICVPTDTGADGHLDTRNVSGILAELFLGKVIIRSTVPVGFTRKAQSVFTNLDIYFAPEFLTEKTAAHDFATEERTIIGTNYSQPVLDKELFPGKINYVTYEEAELIKLATNAFYATKIIFANELWELCGKLDINYVKLINFLAKNPRIGSIPEDNQGQEVHLRVGQDGYRGYGGKCLPKDTLELVKTLGDHGIGFGFLKKVHESNLCIRSKA